MLYRGQLVPLPIVVDADGLPAANSHVEINFPGDVIKKNTWSYEYHC
jgi:hypothetical protein